MKLKSKLKRHTRRLLAALLLCQSAATARAAVEGVTLSSQDGFPFARWMFGAGEPPKGKDVVAILAATKKAQLGRDYSLCLTKAHEARARAKSLQAWLSMVELDCAAHLPASHANADRLARVLDLIDKNPEWLLTGPQASALRPVVIKAHLTLLEQDLKGNRARGWKSIGRVQALLPFTDEKSRAALWRAAGELSFIQQKPEAARDFFRRSLAEVDSEDLRARIQALDSGLRRSTEPGSSPAPSASPGLSPVGSPSGSPARTANAQLEASPDEIELVDRVTTSLKSGDFIAAVEDAVKLIKTYPGGVRAKWATDRVQEIYFNLAEKNDPKFAAVRERVTREAERVDADRLAEWARLAYNRGQYADSMGFARAALKGIEGARATKVLELGAEAALASDHFSEALEMDKTLIEKHAGTSSAREALLRSALINFRQKEYATAASLLERLLVLPQGESLELVARYWLWRSYQKTGSDRAVASADVLIARFPFSYYGLRARMERDGGVLELRALLASQADKANPKVESRLWLTDGERLAWERAQLLLKAGWLDEAQAELKILPQPTRPEDKAVRALLWAAAGQYVNASKLANEAWDENRDLRRPPFVRAAFPNEFADAIKVQAKTNQLEPSLISGLIKQESGFNPRAVSSSNALGAMQMIPPTAKEIATDLKMGSLTLPDDMFDPERNIKMGSHYLAKMLARYQGSVPLALASYNAGPARMDRWLKARASLKNVMTSRSSAPEDELWFDEIPYSETSFYVKAILRNLLLYRVLDQSRVEVPNPVWLLNASN
jgi:soluble lytic murein transglycosylase